MLLAWPKIGMVSTYLSIFVICRYLIFSDSIWLKWHPIMIGILFFLGLFLFLNGYTLRTIGSEGLVALVVICIAYFFRHSKSYTVKVIFILLLMLMCVAKSLPLFQRVLDERNAKQWNSTPYRVPFAFDACVFDVSQWLKMKNTTDKMIIRPVRDQGKVQYGDLRRYGIGPFFYSDDMRDAYGSCERSEEWKRRKRIVEKWVHTGELPYLTENDIGYVVIRRQDEEFFKIPGKFSVYKNEMMTIFDVMNEDVRKDAAESF